MDKQKKMTRRTFAGAAMAGLVAGAGLLAAGCKSNNADNAPGGSADAGAKPGTPANDAAGTAAMQAKHDCKGQNGCKGQGGCDTGDNGCKGKNSCKGKGGCSTK